MDMELCQKSQQRAGFTFLFLFSKFGILAAFCKGEKHRTSPSCINTEWMKRIVMNSLIVGVCWHYFVLSMARPPGLTTPTLRQRSWPEKPVRNLPPLDFGNLNGLDLLDRIYYQRSHDNSRVFCFENLDRVKYRV